MLDAVSVDDAGTKSLCKFSRSRQRRAARSNYHQSHSKPQLYTSKRDSPSKINLRKKKKIVSCP
jgi:hypothetical protein